jgi:hypothetical protein
MSEQFGDSISSLCWCHLTTWGRLWSVCASPKWNRSPSRLRRRVPTFLDVYFSADVETDGPIPGPFSMLSFGLVLAGAFDGQTFSRPAAYNQTFSRELQPVSNDLQTDALRVNGLDRERLVREGAAPASRDDRCRTLGEHNGRGRATRASRLSAQLRLEFSLLVLLRRRIAIRLFTMFWYKDGFCR